MRVVIHPQTAHEHPHLHHHILWALFAMMVLFMLLTAHITGADGAGTWQAILEASGKI